MHEFCRLRDIARSFEAKKTSKHRIDAEAEVQNTLKVIDSLDEKFKDYEVRIHEKQTLQSEKDLTVAGFEANLTILRLRREIGECKDEMLLIQEAIKGMSSGITELKHTYSECEDNKQVSLHLYNLYLHSCLLMTPCLVRLSLQIALQARAELKGKMGTIDRQVKELAGRLKEPNYRNVKERTRKKRVELETTGCAVDDLEKYWGALDKALLRFHGQKISDINRIIRELWQRTYCGEDIDGIEIVSGEEVETNPLIAYLSTCCFKIYFLPTFFFSFVCYIGRIYACCKKLQLSCCDEKGEYCIRYARAVFCRATCSCLSCD